MPARETVQGPEVKIVATNRRARYEYEILDTLEAGIALLGPEVKSLRDGRANLTDAYAMVRRGQAYLVGARISPYAQAARDNPDPQRERKLLLHKAEIERIERKVQEKGLTLVPLEFYFKNGRAKVRLGVARGKRRYDKRETIRRREQDREMQRATRGRGRGRGRYGE